MAKEKAKVHISGTPGAVIEGVREIQDLERKSVDDMNERERFVHYAGNPNCIIRAYREEPVKLVMRDPETKEDRELVDQVKIQTPTTRRELEEYLGKNYGGTSWAVHVEDEYGNRLAGTKIAIDTPPKPVFKPGTVDDDEEDDSDLPFGDAFQAGFDPRTGFRFDAGSAQPRGRYPYPYPYPQDQEYPPKQPYPPSNTRGGWDPQHMGQNWGKGPVFEDPETRIARKKAELEVQRMELEYEEERRQRRSKKEEGPDVREVLRAELGGFQDKVMTAVREMVQSLREEQKEKWNDLRDQRREEKHARELAERDAKHEAQAKANQFEGSIKEIQTRMTESINSLKSELAKASRDDGKTSMFSVLQQVQEGNNRLFAEMNKTMLQVLGAKTSGPSDIDKFVNAFGSLAGLISGEKNTVEIVAESATTTMNKLFEFITERQKAGQAATNAAISEKLDELVVKIAPDIRDTVRNTVMGEVEKRFGPVPKQKPRAQVPKPKPEAGTPPKPAAGTPPKPEAGTPPQPQAETSPKPEAQASAAPTPQPETQPEAATRTPEEREARKRAYFEKFVNKMMDIMLDEMDARPDVSEWVQYAIDYMPEELREKILDEFEGVLTTQDLEKAQEHFKNIGEIIGEYATKERVTQFAAGMKEVPVQQWLFTRLMQFHEAFRGEEEEEVEEEPVRQMPQKPAPEAPAQAEAKPEAPAQPEESAPEK